MEPTFVMMVGLVASGKSTYAKQIAEEIDATVFSSDALREELFGDVNDQNNNQKLFQELHRRVKECLTSGKSAIYDATNLSSKRRRAFLNELASIPCFKQCTIMGTPYEECVERNRNRERQVPEYVIERMYRNWQTPWYFEGWDYIEVCYSENAYDNRVNVDDFLYGCVYYNQHNPHHRLTLGEHMYKASEYVLDRCFNEDDDEVYWAALLHDCGKKFSATFANAKGEPSDICHYYNHENVGAYDALFFGYGFRMNPIYISLLINLHMRPYVWDKEDLRGNHKVREKDRKLWGECLYNDVTMLHNADKSAH